MKYYLQSALLVAFIILRGTIQAQTTVASGNWSSGATWGGVPPLGTGTVVINHTVTLDMDYSHSSGSVTIGASGVLNGNSASRAFALNYPSGTASLTVNGTFNVARTALVSGVVANNAIFKADSLLNLATLTNSNAGSITASQFMNSTGGTINNSGSISSVDFLNIENVSNSGALSSNDLANSKSFTNSSTGIITVTHDFSNLDTLATPAVFTNNGSVTVQNDWRNAKQITGTGKFCISQNSWNAGTMSGSFDFCDQTGGAVDLNTGTIAPTVTYCLFPCTTGIDELAEYGSELSISPNPVHSTGTVVTNFDMSSSVFTVYNLSGQELFRVPGINGRQFEFNTAQFNNGLYLYKIGNEERIVKGKFIVE